MPQVAAAQVCDGLEGVDAAHLQGRTPGCKVVSTPAFQSRRRESEAQRCPPAAGPRVEPTTICFMPAFRFIPVSLPGFPASNLGSKAKEMGKIKLFPTAEYSSKTALGPRGAPGTMHRYLPRPQQVRQNRGADQHDSPSVNIDDSWVPVKKYIEEDLGVNTEQEQAYWDEWDEAALRGIIQRQRKITETSKKLEMKKLYQVLIICDDFADSPGYAPKSAPG